jgi:1-acyl-sn-glycerol-3-phosphate acyltransferase
MRLWGWRFVGTFPNAPRFILIVAPHTSNWDFFVLVIAKLALGIDATWIGKDSLFRWPVRGLLTRLGGIPIDRASPHGTVRQLVARFTTHKQMVFALTPEGTRKRVEHWRSGYWHVAHDARVPIVPVGPDYALKTIFVGPPLVTSESLEEDERKLRSYFASISARRPENYAP